MAKLTEDNFLGGRVTLLQPADGYRAAIDPVFLAASCDAGAGARVLDMGAGTGAAALCLTARVPDAMVTGLEIDAESVASAKKSAALSGLSASASFLPGNASERLLPIPGAPFDAVITNPPFNDPLGSRIAKESSMAQATLMAKDVGSFWFANCLELLRSKGRLHVIWRADRLDLLLELLGPGVGDIHVMPLWPREGVAAKRVLLRAMKGSKAAMTLHPGIVLHEPDGSYTPAADAILRDAGAIDWAGA